MLLQRLFYVVQKRLRSNPYIVTGEVLTRSRFCFAFLLLIEKQSKYTSIDNIAFHDVRNIMISLLNVQRDKRKHVFAMTFSLLSGNTIGIFGRI